MNNVGDWLTGLATVSGMAYFLVGFFAAFIIKWIYCSIKHRDYPVNWRYVGIAMGISMVVFVSLQTQTAYNVARNTAREVQDCQREFNRAIIISRSISAENDALSIEQRDLFAEKDRAETAMWIALIKPNDPSIAALDTSDPKRQQYGLVVVGNYSRDAGRIDREIANIQQRQRELLASRPPLPDVTCGRE